MVFDMSVVFFLRFDFQFGRIFPGLFVQMCYLFVLSAEIYDVPHSASYKG